jgi:hypothetical protein
LGGYVTAIYAKRLSRRLVAVVNIVRLVVNSIGGVQRLFEYRARRSVIVIWLRPVTSQYSPYFWAERS